MFCSLDLWIKRTTLFTRTDGSITDPTEGLEGSADIKVWREKICLYVRLNSENVCVEMREKKKNGRYKSVHLLKTRLSIYVDVYILKKKR